jgi:hypothetical protein
MPMFPRVLHLLLPLIVISFSVAAEESIEPYEIVDRVVAAAGGEAFTEIGVLKLEVSQEEIRAEGSSTTTTFTAYISTMNLDNQRLEYPNKLVIGHSGAGGWSTLAGVQDDRPQTGVRAKRALNQTLFPLLLPHSLKMDGVRASEVREATLNDREVWAVALPMVKGFFNSPVLNTSWLMVADQEDASLVTIEFFPGPEFRNVSPVGVRYRVLEYQEISGTKIPKQILAVGIDARGQESGGTRVTKIEASVHGTWDPTLFISPAQLEALEEQD